LALDCVAAEGVVVFGPVCWVLYIAGTGTVLADVVAGAATVVVGVSEVTARLVVGALVWTVNVRDAGAAMVQELRNESGPKLEATPSFSEMKLMA
jgi:hypothetical protein